MVGDYDGRGLRIMIEILRLIHTGHIFFTLDHEENSGVYMTTLQHFIRRIPLLKSLCFSINLNLTQHSHNYLIIIIVTLVSLRGANFFATRL